MDDAIVDVVEICSEDFDHILEQKELPPKLSPAMAKANDLHKRLLKD